MGQKARTGILFLIMALLLAACASQAPTSPSEAGPPSTTTPTDQPAADQPPAQLTKVVARMQWFGSPAHVPYVVALEKGWYAARGLDVEVLDGQGTPQTTMAVGTNQADFGNVDLSSFPKAREDLDVVAVAQIVYKGVISLIVPVESDVQVPKDIEGKEVIFTPGASEHPLIPEFFKVNGVDESKVKMISLESNAKHPFYYAGNADAIFSTAPFVLPQQERPSRALLLSDWGVPLPSFGIIAHRDYVNANPEVVSAFVEATMMGLEWAEANPEEAVAIYQKYWPDIDYDNVLEQFVAYQPFREVPQGLRRGEFDMEMWAQSIDLLERIGAIDEVFELEAYVTNNFIPDTLPNE